MKTNEVEKLLGLSKHTILYYEKEGLIHPHRDDNGYRHFEEKDIQLLELIMKLRSMEMSIDEIHDVLDGKASIRDILDVKEDYLKQKKEELDQKHQAIQEHKKREKVNIAFVQEFVNKQQYETLYFHENQIQFLDLSISLMDIQKIKISMCSEIGIFNIIRTFMNYYVDIDIVTGFDTYSYQIMNDDAISKLFQYLHQHHIIIDDTLGLENIYTKMTDSVQRNKYLNTHFQKWAKKYNLDNPRGKYMQTKQSDSHNYNQMVDNVLKEFHMKK